MKNFNKLICPGKTDDGNLFIEIKLKDGNLSLSGVIGPLRNGDCKGSCGQISEHLKEITSFFDSWDTDKVKKLYDIWEEWHLNDLQAGCEHQRSEKWENIRINPEELPNSHANMDEKGILASWVYPKDHPSGLLTKPCPICGYKYGTAWLKKEVPEDVLMWLNKLEETNKNYPWSRH